ncbi:MAG: family 16 glycosylhydrolase [Planktomarina sp.]
MHINKLGNSALALLVGAVPSAAEGPFSDHFARLDRRHWAVAHYNFTHPAFDTDWRREQLHVDNGLQLSLTPHDGPENQFIGASVRRRVPTRYGMYSAIIQPAKGDGLVTGFFTYTGPHYGTPHDEIDIEFLGKDTTQMHVAWFVNGVLHQRDIPLGFDAADRPCLYGFEWQPDFIRWYAEGRPIFTVTRDTAPIPTEPGMLFANLWTVDKSVQNWAGLAPDGTHAKAQVLSMEFVPTPDAGS